MSSTCFTVALLAVTTVALRLVPGPASNGGSGSVPNEQWLTAAAAFNAAPYNGSTNCNASSGIDCGVPSCGDVLYVHSTADVIDALVSAMSRSQVGAPRIQVRSGSHSYLASAATTFAATVIDVSGLNNVVLVERGISCGPTYPAKHDCAKVSVGPGTRLFTLYDELSQLGYMFPGGSCPTVAVGGYILGGGYGLWSRALGLGVDNVLQATLAFVDANNHVTVTNCSAAENPELFRALLGGGNNNFGAVTSFDLRVYPVVPTVSEWRLNIANAMVCNNEAFELWQRSATVDWDAVLARPLAFSPSTLPTATPGAPQRVTISFDMYRETCSAIVLAMNTSSSTLLDGLAAVGWLNLTSMTPSPASTPVERSFIETVADMAGCGNSTTCREFTKTYFPGVAAPTRWISTTSYQFAPSTPELTTLFTAALQTAPTDDDTFVVAICDSYGGAINRTAQDAATSFPHHGALYHVQLWVQLSSSNATRYDDGASLSLRVLAALDTIATRTAPERELAAYRNYASPFLPDALQRYYGVANLAFLRTVKRTYDPENYFGFDQGLFG
jgi:FAD/FMN-containing dehydrogenase